MRYICVRLQSQFSTGPLNFAYPAIMAIPPRGVTGPSILRLYRYISYPSLSLYQKSTCRSRPKMSAQILPENTSPPHAIAGPANRCVANLG